MRWRTFARTFPACYHVTHLARDNPDCGTYKAGYRVTWKIILIADITRSMIDIARYTLTLLGQRRWRFYSRRVINRRLPVIGSRYAFTVQASPKPAAAPSTVLSKAARSAPRDRGSCSCRRGQGRLPRRRRAPFSKEWTRRGLLTKGSTGFRHPSTTTSRERRYRSDVPGSIIPARVPLSVL